jgi:transcription factor SFP1
VLTRCATVARLPRLSKPAIPFSMPSTSLTGKANWYLSFLSPRVLPRSPVLSQCRNYTCCGLHLNDLHALLEHFEAVHIMIVDGDIDNPQMQIPFNPIINTAVSPPPSDHQAAFDPDDMELELELDNSTSSLAPPPTVSHSSPSSGAPTPPDTPISTPLSAWPSPHAFRSQHITPASSQPPSPRSKTAAPTRTSSPVPASTLRPNLSINLAGASVFSRGHASSPHVLANPEDAFNSYARFSQDYSSGLPGAQFNPAPADEASMVTNPPHNARWQQSGGQQPGCVPPALLFSSSVTATPASTPGGSRVPSPSGYTQTIAQPQPHPALSSASMPTTPISSTSTSRPSAFSRTMSAANPSLLLSKPFKCPKPNCNKSYKQANGLKYHMTHGSCNFAPPKDLEHVKDLLERKKRERERERDLGFGRSFSGSNTPATSGPATPTTELAAEYGITEMDLREVEKEAERRLRPFACGVGDCQRRYKNMNGLRYHYQHSGEHGAQGLALLASGQHECLQGAKRSHHSSNQQPLRSPQPQQPQQPVPQATATKIHVTPVTVTPPLAQQGLQQQSTGIYTGQVGYFTSSPRAYINWCLQHYSTQQQNPYAYTCYARSNASQQPGTPSPSSSSSSGTSSSSIVPVAAYQQQSSYFGNASNGAYLGVGLGLGINSLMGAGYSQAQIATFHQQFKEQYRGFATQIQQQQQQQQQQSHPANEDPTA